MLRPVHFEIQADDIARATKFYQDVFNWKITQWENWQYWMIITGEKGSTGIDGGLMPRKGPVPAIGEGAAVNSFVITMDVANFDEVAAKIIAGGGANVVPKMAMTGMAWLGYFKDTEGNLFGLFQGDKNAK